MYFDWVLDYISFPLPRHPILFSSLCFLRHTKKVQEEIWPHVHTKNLQKTLQDYKRLLPVHFIGCRVVKFEIEIFFKDIFSSSKL